MTDFRRIIAAEQSIIEATASVMLVDRLLNAGLEQHPELYNVLGTAAVNLHQLKLAATRVETRIIEAMKQCKP